MMMRKNYDEDNERRGEAINIEGKRKGEQMKFKWARGIWCESVSRVRNYW